MFIIALVLLGLCLGSFVNALVWRLHEQTMPAKKRAASLKELSITQGRSMCPHCKHQLSALDLVPVFSWLFLKGRCRYCKHPIGAQYPLVEALTAIVFALSYVFWPLDMDSRGIFLLVVWLITLVMLVALVVYDIRWMLLPNKLVFPLIGLGVLQAITVATVFDGGWQYIVRVALAVLVAGGLFYVLFQVSDGHWIGGGDVKLGYALGLLLATPQLAMIALFIASLLGLVVSIPGLLTKKKGMESRIPFGPYLIAGTCIAMLFGESLIQWYVGLLI
jgi:prepilin signal peptidase PulO-like enzyme (type II secretory pathway)